MYFSYKNKLPQNIIDNKNVVVNVNKQLNFKKYNNRMINYNKNQIQLNINPTINLSEDVSYNLNTILNNKSCFRVICNIVNNLTTIKIPPIRKKTVYEAVLIEFRILPHLAFLIKNTISHLGSNWCHTIVCGNLNYDYMKNICNTISPNIDVIKLPYDNLNQSTYSMVLSSTKFWNLFYGDKILIYQEDSIIFNYGINNYLYWDYIGAPWKNNQNDTNKLVGNGGFSLRSKDVMLKTIDTLNIFNIKVNSHTADYMTNTKMTVCPEDVYFCKTIEDYYLGTIPNSDIASSFSTECILNYDSLGGHNFWLSDNNWINRVLNIYNTILNIELIKILTIKYKCVCISSPYNYNIGGGEKYLSFIIKFFIKQNYKIIFCINVENITEIKNTLNFYFDKTEQSFIYLSHFKTIYNNNIEFINFHYFVFMCNSGIPCKDIKVNGNINILHTQFPFDYLKYKDRYTDSEITNIINKYNKVIVNSEFTHNTLVNMYNQYNYNINNINIIYPPCFENIEIKNNEKIPNTFVMLGRIFEYNIDANNKYFDVAIKVFNELKYLDYNLVIIGSNKSYKQLEYLTKLMNNNNKIKILTDVNENIKNTYLNNSKYFIQLTGINDKYLYNKEHFGISMIEAINYNCIPISINEGYPSYLIKNNKNGYIINNSEELKTLIIEILNNTNKPIYEKIDINPFSYDQFFNNLSKCVNS